MKKKISGLEILLAKKICDSSGEVRSQLIKQGLKCSERRAIAIASELNRESTSPTNGAANR